ncbi:hypothetical protein SPURM210S_00442 [Streptomyces purpurascens]
MSRTRSVAGSGQGIHRRSVLAAGGAVALSAGVGYALRPSESQAATAKEATEAVAASSRQAPAAPLAPYTKGTTLASVATPRGSSGYRRLGDGAGWQRVVRSDLAAPKSGRAGRRTPLAAFVQLTDLHIIDAQHPLRLEYLRSADIHAWRPHEALTVQGAIALVERINALRGAPVTGAPLHFAMTTGDNTDNNAKSELDWFLKIMSGGRIAPTPGTRASTRASEQRPQAVLAAGRRGPRQRQAGRLPEARRLPQGRRPGGPQPRPQPALVLHGRQPRLPADRLLRLARRLLPHRTRRRRQEADGRVRGGGAAAPGADQEGPGPPGRPLPRLPQVPRPLHALGHPGREPRPPSPRPNTSRPTWTRPSAASAQAGARLRPPTSTRAPSTTPSASPTTSSASAWTPPTRAATTSSSARPR